MGATPLAQRIKAEFDAQEKRAGAVQQDRAGQAQVREQRLAQFEKVCESLKDVWRPRLEEFAKQFGDKIKITPTVTPTQRDAKVAFMTDLANTELTLTAAPNNDVTKLVLDYDLLILPMLMEYERHARFEAPLDKIDKDAVGAWIDDRLISCVKTYLALGENEFYLKRRADAKSA
jgi:hypothetical protein